MTCSKCGLSISGSASRCPRCLTVIPKDNVSPERKETSPQTKPAPTASGTNLQPITVSLQPISWNNSLTTTQNFINEITVMYKAFDKIILQSDQINVEISSVQEKIQTEYKQKITLIENKRDSLRFEAEVKNDSAQKNADSSISNLNNIEQKIQQNLKNSYQKKDSYSPVEPDFMRLNQLVNRVNKPGSQLLGFLYLIPVVGWIAQGVIRLLLTFHTNKLRNTLMNEIESGREYFNSLVMQSREEYSRTLSNIEKDYFDEKKELDKKLPGFMQVIEKEKKSRTTALENEIEIKGGKALFHSMDKRNTSMLEELGGTESVWTEKYEAAYDFPIEILLGKIGLPITLPRVILSQLIPYIPSGITAGPMLKIPFTMPMNKPVNLIIDYEKSFKEKVMSGVQSIIMKLLRFMPLFTYKITYIDPNDRGSNLGLLQKLSGITYFDVCRKVYATREDIQRRLKELEIFVDNTSETIAGYDSVYSYNSRANSQIEYHFIIINDYPENFERNALESLEVLIKNSKKCGISIIFTTNCGMSDFPNDILQNFSLINYRENQKEIKYEDTSYLFMFDQLTDNCENFLERFKHICNEGIKVENDFTSYFSISENQAPAFSDSTNKMLIPFAVDTRKNIVDLELGSPLTAHALLSGTTGSGKSTTLHMLITSIVMKYHPDDVQLWLVDYKRVEFAEYIENTPPHVKLIGLERSSEFTFSLLDMIDEEFQRRTELFKKAGVSNIAEYRRNGGKIPRIIFIVDEFHQMTQAIQNEPHYSQILENILSEYRVFGLSCIFSDQAISVGLRGLTEKGKMQIRTRLAMSNDFSEIKETLALDHSFYDEEAKAEMHRMGVGDVMYKRMLEDQAGESQPVLKKYKTIYVRKEERVSAIEWVTKAAGKAREKPLVVDGQRRSSWNQKIINDFEKGNDSIGKQIPLYMGTPASLNPCFNIFLREKIDSNIMVIGANDELRAAVVYWSIYSFKRQNTSKVYVFADKNDELFSQYKEKYESLSDNNCLVTTDIGGICRILNELEEKLQPGAGPRTFIVWLGLENIAQEFAFLPEKPNIKTTRPKSSGHSALDALEASIGAMYEEVSGTAVLDGTDVPKNESELSGTQTENTAYNAVDDIQEIIAKGSRYGIFTLVTYSSFKSLRDTKFVKTDNFEHKIAFNMSMDESSTYLGRSSHASGLDNITAVYYDGSSIKTFRPYLI